MGARCEKDRGVRESVAQASRQHIELEIFYWSQLKFVEHEHEQLRTPSRFTIRLYMVTVDNDVAIASRFAWKIVRRQFT